MILNNVIDELKKYLRPNSEPQEEKFPFSF
jgi:hypothetical protein